MDRLCTYKQVVQDYFTRNYLVEDIFICKHRTLRYHTMRTLLFNSSLEDVDRVRALPWSHLTLVGDSKC